MKTFQSIFVGFIKLFHQSPCCHLGSGVTTFFWMLFLITSLCPFRIRKDWLTTGYKHLPNVPFFIYTGFLSQRVIQPLSLLWPVWHRFFSGLFSPNPTDVFSHESPNDPYPQDSFFIDFFIISNSRYPCLTGAPNTFHIFPSALEES